MNKVILIGRLSKDVECRYSNDGKAIANISIAVDRKFKRDGQPSADFFNCTAFGKTAEFLEKYFRKGSKVVISGSLQNESWEKDGKKYSATKILVDEVEFGESKNTDASVTHQNAHTDDFIDMSNIDTDSLPFN